MRCPTCDYYLPTYDRQKCPKCGDCVGYYHPPNADWQPCEKS